MTDVQPLETTVHGPGTHDPSYLCVDPGGAFVYVVNEMTSESGVEGSVSAFVRYPASGELRFLNQRSTGGFAPCHVSVDPSGRHVLVANYESGNVGVLPTLADGRLEPLSDLVEYEGSGPHPQRQTGPHAHMILPDPLRDRLAPHVRAYTCRDLRRLLAGLSGRVLVHTQIFPGYDKIAARWPTLGQVLRQVTYFLEKTPLRLFGLSHFLVMEKGDTTKGA